MLWALKGVRTKAAEIQTDTTFVGAREDAEKNLITPV